LINSWFYASVTDAPYRKDTTQADHINLGKQEAPFQFRQLTPALQYIRLGHFSAYTKDMKTSQAFYDGIKDSLTAPHLIIDLRNNTGGAEKVFRKYLSLLKRYTRKGQVSVLVNNGTMSAGEMFTLQLKRLSNTTVYGQTTRGTIAYGSNYDRRQVLPSGLYKVMVTDMKDQGHYLRYEDKGVNPDITLNNEADWIEQIKSKL
jgi:C-terminal processing protease CtpA/Prc